MGIALGLVWLILAQDLTSPTPALYLPYRGRWLWTYDLVASKPQVYVLLGFKPKTLCMPSTHTNWTLAILLELLLFVITCLILPENAISFWFPLICSCPLCCWGPCFRQRVSRAWDQQEYKAPAFVCMVTNGEFNGGLQGWLRKYSACHANMRAWIWILSIHLKARTPPPPTHTHGLKLDVRKRHRAHDAQILTVYILSHGPEHLKACLSSGILKITRLDGLCWLPW